MAERGPETERFMDGGRWKRGDGGRGSAPGKVYNDTGRGLPEAAGGDMGRWESNDVGETQERRTATRTRDGFRSIFTHQLTRPLLGMARTVRVVFYALLLDILAFTCILPLLPRLLDAYQKNSDTDPLLAPFLSAIHTFRATFDPRVDPLLRDRKLDTVLLGGLLGSLFSLLQFIASPVLGRLSDLYGRRPILLLSMLGNLLSSLLWLTASSFSTFLWSRVVGGISEANVQLSQAIIADTTSPERRSSAMALVGIAFAIGFTLGPALGAYLATYDFSNVFNVSFIHAYSTPALFAFFLLLVESIYLYVALPETRKMGKHGDTTQPLLQKQDPTSTSSLSARQITLLTAIHFIYLFLFSGMEYTLTFLTFDVFNFSNMDQGKLLGVIGLVSAAIQGGYVRRKRRTASDRQLVLAGMLACISGLVLIAASCHGSVYVLWIGVLGLAVASATVVNALNTLVSLHMDQDTQLVQRRGHILGVFRSRGQLGRACGPVVTCALYWLYGPFLVYLGASAALALLFLFSHVSLTDPLAQPHPKKQT